MNIYRFILLLVICVSCNRNLIKTGDVAYEARHFSEATKLFSKEYEATSDDRVRAELAFKCAISFDKIGMLEDATSWMYKSLDNLKTDSGYKHYVEFLIKQEKYDTAINVIRNWIAVFPNSKSIAGKHLSNCRYAEERKKAIPEYKIEKFEYNSSFSDFAPRYIDDHRLLFSSERSKSGLSSWTGRSNVDIYCYDELTKELVDFPDFINSEHDEGTACVNDNMDVIYFTRCVDNDTKTHTFCNIYSVQKSEGVWQKPIKLNFQKDGFNYLDPFWSQSDSVLFFTSDINVGYGYDLFFSRLNGDNTWTKIQSLSGSLNTAGNERFPVFINDTLFYSSDGLIGMGGLDLYMTHYKDNKWSIPENLPVPLNSGGDDFAITFSSDGFGRTTKRGFITSSRFGLDDILSFQKIQILDKKESVEDVENNKLDTIYRLAISVRHEDDGKIMSFPTASVMLNESNVKLNNQGFYIAEILKNSHTVNVSASGYYSQVLTVKPEDFIYQNSDQSYLINVNIDLTPIVLNQEITLKNILYDFNDYRIRDDAKPALDELIELLEINPEIRIELSSHTDCRGPDDYNLKLSQKRAKSAAEYLISNGIAMSRIEAKGYGELKPISNCICATCSDIEHSENRRTAFTVIAK